MKGKSILVLLLLGVMFSLCVSATTYYENPTSVKCEGTFYSSGACSLAYDGDWSGSGALCETQYANCNIYLNYTNTGTALYWVAKGWFYPTHSGCHWGKC